VAKKPAKPKPKPKAKRGAKAPKAVAPPIRYTDEVGAAICERLAAGESLRAICRDPGMPSEKAVRLWALDDKHPFAPHYARARELQLYTWADELFDISDDGRNDWMEKHDRDGNSLGWRLNGEHVQRSRLRVDTRKWMLARMLPRIYGDKLSTELTGKDGDAIQVEAGPVSDLELARRIAFALQRASDRIKAERGDAE
jgi:hypothetical protein